MKRRHSIRLFIILNQIFAVTVAVPISVGNLEPEIQATFSRLTPEAQKNAKYQLEKMGSYDPERTKLHNSGRFFFIEDPVDKASDFEMLPVQSETISDNPPSGYTTEGIPIFHSLPGSPNVIYLNFLGGRVANTAWNDLNGIAPFDALPYNTDNASGFSASEQAAIANIWRRVTEDYAPWSIDVTTERPANLTPTTLVAFITKNSSAANTPLPFSNAGGVAFLGIFGYSDAAYYRPAFIYYNNLAGGREDVVAEATSHELGHNFGLAHDGVTGGSSYYGGAGSGDISWGPIMGASYFRSVVKFNNGDYPNANNHEDDLAIITSVLPRKIDDVGNTIQTAKPIQNAGGFYKFSGINESYTDVDIFSVDIAAGNLSASVKPFTSSSNTVGNNVDLALQILDAQGNPVASSDPQNSSSASLIGSNLPAGRYYIKVYPVGNSVTPYSLYGSMGQYDLSGQYTSGSQETIIYSETMVTAPTGWTFSGAGLWQYGRPTSSSDPKDFNVVGNIINGTGLYPEPITGTKYLITSAFSTVGFSSVTLSFDRFLGVKADDVVTVKACITTPCTLLWKNKGDVVDTSWKKIEIPLPASFAGQPSVRIRFGLGPVKSNGTILTNSFGWNIKNFVISGK